MAVANSETHIRFSIFDFACLSPENLETLYLKFLGIPSLPKIIITKKIYLCDYDENDVPDKENW